SCSSDLRKLPGLLELSTFERGSQLVFELLAAAQKFGDREMRPRVVRLGIGVVIESSLAQSFDEGSVVDTQFDERVVPRVSVEKHQVDGWAGLRGYRLCFRAAEGDVGDRKGDS